MRYLQLDMDPDSMELLFRRASRDGDAITFDDFETFMKVHI